MYPMLEMARNGHIKFIPDVLVIYNMANALNDHKISGNLQEHIHKIIRSMNPYDTIEYLFDPE